MRNGEVASLKKVYQVRNIKLTTQFVTASHIMITPTLTLTFTAVTIKSTEHSITETKNCMKSCLQRYNAVKPV
jgi:hypothetical protein